MRVQRTLFTYELVWNAVVGFLHLDVIVDVHGGLSPTCEDVALIRQWVERGPIKFLVKGTAGSFKLLEGIVVAVLEGRYGAIVINNASDLNERVARCLLKSLVLE